MDIRSLQRSLKDRYRQDPARHCPSFRQTWRVINFGDSEPPNECYRDISPIELPYADCGKVAVNNPAIVINPYGFRGTNDSRGGIAKDVVKECSGGWVPS